MKKLLIILLVLINFAANAQERKLNSFGLTAGVGSATVVRAALAGAPSFELNNNFEFGLNYYRQIGEKLKFETGLIYHYNELAQKSAIRPDVSQTTTLYDVHLLYLPAFLRYNFTEHFFINGGGMVDIDVSNNLGLESSRALNSQSGLGLGIGIGGEVAVMNKWYLQLNPYLNMHGVLPVQGESYPGRIMDAGIKVGIRIE